MKTLQILLVVGLIISSTASFGQKNIEVTIKNVKHDKGKVRVGLFTSEETFLKKAAFGQVTDARNGEVTVKFENLKPGEYAISVIHDENENGELDTNGVGMPKEGFGFGNNAMGFFGPPSFDKAKIKIDDSGLVRHTIELKYL